MSDADIALVTGASRGIGRAIAVALAQAGHPVALVARDRAQLEETAALAGGTARAVVVPADLSSFAAVEEVCARVHAELGPVTVLVNNAGIASPEVPFTEQDPSQWEQVLRVNLLAPMWLCRALLPAMVERGHGVVVNVNSLGGCQPFATQSAYAASKAGLCRLTDTLALELGDAIQLFDVSPGLVRTDMTTDLEMWKEVPDEYWTSPDVVARLVTALATGRYAALSGRFLHAPTDEVDDLVANLDSDSARTLRLTPSHPRDPLFP